MKKLMMLGLFVALPGCSPQHTNLEIGVDPACQGHKCKTTHLAFTGFQGEHVTLKFDGTVILDENLYTRDKTSDASKILEVQKNGPATADLRINNISIVEDVKFRKEGGTLYIDARPPHLMMTNHGAPLLD